MNQYPLTTCSVSHSDAYKLGALIHCIYHRSLFSCTYVYKFNREVIAIKEKEYGADHPSVAMELNNLAVSYCHMVRNRVTYITIAIATIM